MTGAAGCACLAPKGSISTTPIRRWPGLARSTRRAAAPLETVEEALYRHRQPLFGAVSIAFFDTTTLWFEGAGGESLGQHGHSKDYRGHLKQVVLGIVLDDADRPIASFLMPGNTADGFGQDLVGSQADFRVWLAFTFSPKGANSRLSL